MGFPKPRALSNLDMWCCKQIELSTALSWKVMAAIALAMQSFQNLNKQAWKSIEHRGTQKSTEEHRKAQRSTEKPRETQKSTEKHRKAQRSTEQHKHRKAQKSTRQLSSLRAAIRQPQEAIIHIFEF